MREKLSFAIKLKFEFEWFVKKSGSMTQKQIAKIEKKLVRFGLSGSLIVALKTLKKGYQTKYGQFFSIFPQLFVSTNL